jgi:hypothetical protein
MSTYIYKTTTTTNDIAYPDMPTKGALEKVPQRAVTFLFAIGMQPALEALLGKFGYTPEDHARGWALVFIVGGIAIDPKAAASAAQSEAAAAVGEIDAWESGGFARAQAALRHLHPAQERFVFADLVAGRGAEAIQPLMTFLDRLDALESSPERKATRKADSAALATLASRELDEKLRKHLRERVVTASTLAGTATEHVPVDVEKRIEALHALYRWHEDWSNTARTVIKRRADLISLGLAKRQDRKPKKKPNDTPAVPPAPAVPLLPAAPAVPVESVESEEKGPSSRAA